MAYQRRFPSREDQEPTQAFHPAQPIDFPEGDDPSEAYPPEDAYPPQDAYAPPEDYIPQQEQASAQEGWDMPEDEDEEVDLEKLRSSLLRIKEVS